MIFQLYQVVRARVCRAFLLYDRIFFGIFMVAVSYSKIGKLREQPTNTGTFLEFIRDRPFSIGGLHITCYDECDWTLKTYLVLSIL